MFAARNRPGVDKSLPLDPIRDTNRIVIKDKKEERQRGKSLERGRKVKLSNKGKKENIKRSQSEIPSLQHANRKISDKTKSEMSRKPYVFKVAPNLLKTSKPVIRKSKTKEKRDKQTFAPKAGLVQCKNCTRSFASDRIETHRNICKKTAKKRKPFDVSKSRVEGTDAGNFTGKPQGIRKKKVGYLLEKRK